MALGTVIKQISTVNYNQPMQNQMLMLWPIYQFYVRNFTWQKFKSPRKLLSLILKSQSHVIQARDENLALIPIVGKFGFISQIKHTAEATKHGSISFKIDNMHYVNFRI